MKKKNLSPYRTMGLKKIEAPKPPAKDEPKGNVMKGDVDYRIGGKK